MLAKYWRYRILWDADQTLTYNDGARISVRSCPWKLVSGALTYGTTIVDDMALKAGVPLEWQPKQDLDTRIDNLLKIEAIT